MKKRLDRTFFERKTLIVARDLIGKVLVRKIGSSILRARITETEAYCGQKDLASHASKGLTPRTKIMFGPAGYSYVYLIYGMYHCLNVVTEREGNPAAVLIRGVILNLVQDSTDNRLAPAANRHLDARPLTKHQASGSARLLAVNNIQNLSRVINGPGKLCRELKIDKKLNAIDMTMSKELWIEDDGAKPGRTIKTPRIGVDYAGEYKDKLWRFVLESKQ
jgi:DNA-3-methyladenine glycosylase